MNDQEVDRYISKQIRDRRIGLYDIIGGKFIDPDPHDNTRPANKRARWNRFKSEIYEHRLCELLTEGDFDPDLPYNNLAIPLKDLMRYWWNRICDQEAVIEVAFDGILTCYKDKMLPEEEGPVDTSDALDEIQEAI